MKCSASPKGHRFQKFDESSLFCERCGERRVIAPRWYPDWTYRPYPYWTNPWYPGTVPLPYVVTSIATGTVTTGSTLVTDGVGNESTLTVGD